jgi:serine/threonine protein phosphatase PrpC
MDLSYFSISSIGKVRKSNQDCFINETINDLNAFVLCDGMGGKNGGDIASKIAVDSIISFISKNQKINFKDLINSSFQYANSNILKEAGKNSLHEGMGTTAVLVISSQNQFHFGHVGDSRIYYIEESKIEQITKDHSLIQHLLDSGEITIEMAANHPMRNIITHALGSSLDINFNYYVTSFFPVSNSYILLCSDGLNSMISDSEIVSSFSCVEPEEIANNLIEKALDAGGKDNVTVTVIRVFEKLDSEGLPKYTTKGNNFIKRIFKR